MKYLCLRGNWVSELGSPGAIQQDEELDWLGAKFKRERERANSKLLKVKEKKKPRQKISPSFPVLLNIMGVKLATGNKIWKEE